MPIYEYQCTACGHKLDAFQKMTDDPLKDCPECKEPGLKKCVTAAAFKLKGTGWYETDFKHQKKPEKKTAETKDTTGGKEKDSGKGESDSGSPANADTGKSTKTEPGKSKAAKDSSG